MGLEEQAVEVDLAAALGQRQHFDAEHFALGIVVEHHAGRDFLGLRRVYVREGEVERIWLAINAQFDAWLHSTAGFGTTAAAASFLRVFGPGVSAFSAMSPV